MTSKYQSKLAEENGELKAELADADQYIEEVETELETTQAKNEKLTEQIGELAQFGAVSFFLNLVQDQVLKDDRALLRRSMDTMREASTVITNYRDAEAAAKAKAQSERDARSQPTTSNWAKAREISFAADGVPVVIRPNRNWTTNTVTSAEQPHPKSTTTATATVELNLPFIGKQILSAAVKSVETVWHRDGDCRIINEVTFELVVGGKSTSMIITSDGSMDFSLNEVESYTNGSPTVKIGEDKVCYCGNRNCRQSTPAPIFELKDLSVS